MIVSKKLKMIFGKRHSEKKYSIERAGIVEQTKRKKVQNMI
jgi:hypothetical protein